MQFSPRESGINGYMKGSIITTHYGVIAARTPLPQGKLKHIADAIRFYRLFFETVRIAAGTPLPRVVLETVQIAAGTPLLQVVFTS